MIIAFEGPDKTGKSTSADFMSSIGESNYNMTDDSYAEAVNVANENPTIVETFDRIDWLTHTVYRLALPGYEWNDKRVRTVFAAPQAHLVIKIHDQDTIQDIPMDELYKREQLAYVNRVYRSAARSLIDLNEMSHFEIFKSITVLTVQNTPAGYGYRCQEFSSPVRELDSEERALLDNDLKLLEHLRYEEQHQG